MPEKDTPQTCVLQEENSSNEKFDEAGNSTHECDAEEKINTDGRKQYDWKSRYPQEAHKEMRIEAIYIFIILVFALLGLFGVWYGIFTQILNLDAGKQLVFEKILFYFLGGLLGGTIYGIKYFYRVVARGYWSQDRKYWRLFSPWISSCVALIVGCMISAGFINAVEAPSNFAGVCIGFVSGYFADDAVSKMSEVAKALFGTSSKTK